MKVKIVQQASGAGSYPVGTILDLPEAEARGLCRTTASQPTPFAIPVVEDRTETADAPAAVAVETRGETTAAAKPAVVTPQEPPAQEPPAAEEPPAKRGPGRPPGSTNKPKPQ